VRSFQVIGVPVAAVIAQCVLALGFAIASDRDHLVRLIGFTLSIFAALAVGSIFVFRARGHVAPFRTLGYPVTPIIFIAVSLWAVYFGISAQPRLSLEIAGMHDLHRLGERPGGALNRRRPAIAQLQRAQLQHLIAGRVLPPRTGPLHADRHKALARRLDVAAAARQPSLRAAADSMRDRRARKYRIAASTGRTPSTVTLSRPLYSSCSRICATAPSSTSP
jgi:hypothetical protein